MRAPRELADLPYASHLEAHGGEELRRDEDYDVVHFREQEFDGSDAGNARFTESAFTAVKLTEGTLRRARFNDVWLHGVQVIGTDLVETRWLDGEVVNSALAGTAAFGADLNRVAFFGCKLVSVNLRDARLREVAFVDSVLRDVDFGGAELTGVTFPGSTLEDTRFDGARLAKTDFRDAAALGVATGHDSLGGATISLAQALDLAPAFARALGVTVKDR